MEQGNTKLLSTTDTLLTEIKESLQNSGSGGGGSTGTGTDVLETKLSTINDNLIMFQNNQNSQMTNLLAQETTGVSKINNLVSIGNTSNTKIDNLLTLKMASNNIDTSINAKLSDAITKLDLSIAELKRIGNPLLINDQNTGFINYQTQHYSFNNPTSVNAYFGPALQTIYNNSDANGMKAVIIANNIVFDATANRYNGFITYYKLPI